MNSWILVTALTLPFSVGAQTPPSPAPLKIMIDPGHGGTDSGAKVDGTREADLVLEVAKKLKTQLEKETPFQVAITRNDDTRVSLHDRVRKAQAAGSDLFVSLHANSSTDSRARGMELYFQSQVPPDQDTLLLAAIENQRELLGKNKVTGQELSKNNNVAMIVEDLRMNSRIRASRRMGVGIARQWGVDGNEGKQHLRQAPFHVVTRIKIPSILIELGYLTHAADRQRLKSPEIQAKIADGVTKGLKEFAASYQLPALPRVD